VILRWSVVGHLKQEALSSAEGFVDASMSLGMTIRLPGAKRSMLEAEEAITSEQT
jgi:hypothetical protein